MKRFLISSLYLFLTLHFSSAFSQTKSAYIEYDCPNFDKNKKDGKKWKNSDEKEIKISKVSHTIKFNPVNLTERKLEIPSFMHFKNNQTDFTASGEEEFKSLVEKTKLFLGANKRGYGVQFHISGCASQIPTSFDFTKPNNNILPDGTSIKGKTSIQNNKMLALSRAIEMGKKIKAEFPDIGIEIPTLQQIKLGTTPWNAQKQKQLNKAYEKKDTAAIANLYEPYQKDQYVTVKTNEYTQESVQAKTVFSYLITISPALVSEQNGQKIVINEFLVSENSFNKLTSAVTFKNTDERDEYLHDVLKVAIVHKSYNNHEHWFMLTPKESLGLRQTDDYRKVKSLHRDKIYDVKDRDILQEVLIKEAINELQ
jgi:hypothetical protein